MNFVHLELPNFVNYFIIILRNFVNYLKISLFLNYIKKLILIYNYY